jgi:hypothetical protein
VEAVALHASKNVVSLTPSSCLSLLHKPFGYLDFTTNFCFDIYQPSNIEDIRLVLQITITHYLSSVEINYVLNIIYIKEFQIEIVVLHNSGSLDSV